MYDTNDLEECVRCGIHFCPSCSAIGITGRFCKNCGEFIKEKIHGNQNFHMSMPDPDMNKREELLLKFKSIDIRDKQPLHMAFEENQLAGYNRTPLHFTVPEVMKPKETMLMKFPELLMEKTKEEMHVQFNDSTMLAENKEELHMAFPENFLKKDILTDMALKG